MNGIRVEATTWLKGEIAAGRLAPDLDAAELATVASILTKGLPNQVRRRLEQKEAASDGHVTATSAPA